MSAAILSNPTFSSSFNGRRILLRGNSSKRASCCFSFKSPRCAVDTPYEGNISKFPRTSVWDPYKRLGVSTDASEEEVWSARNFLLDQYASHERNAESIEAVDDKFQE